MKYQTTIDFGFDNTMSLIAKELDPNSTVLEFGPASGRLTKYMTEKKCCQVYIVEIDEEAAAIAKKYAKDAVVGDIQEYKWLEQFEKIRFDFILFADVLEHLYDPRKVLRQASTLLKSDGKIIFSVPNIAHNSIIIDLMKNKFDYQPTGLLDETHIRFWTQEIIEEVLKECKLFTYKKMATYTQVGHNEFDNTYDELNKMGINERILKQRRFGEVYQYIYIVSKNKREESADEIRSYADYYYLQYYVGEKTYKQFIMGDERKIHLEIKLDGTEKKIRIDPVNASSIIKIVKIEGRTFNGEDISLKIESSNAFIVENNLLFFENNDAQFYVEIENCEKVLLDYELLDYGNVQNMNLMLKEIKSNQDIIMQKQNYIEEVQEQCAELKQKKSELENINQSMQEELYEYKKKYSELKNENIVAFVKRKYEEKRGR